VRVTDGEGSALDRVYLALTDREAAELADALAGMRVAGEGWHAHVSDAGFSHEITVARADDEPAA